MPVVIHIGLGRWFEERRKAIYIHIKLYIPVNKINLFWDVSEYVKPLSCKASLKVEQISMKRALGAK